MPPISPIEQIGYLVQDLEAKQRDFPCRERALAITNLQQGQHWLQALERNERDRDEPALPPGPPPFAGGSG